MLIMYFIFVNFSRIVSDAKYIVMILLLGEGLIACFGRAQLFETIISLC